MTPYVQTAVATLLNDILNSPDPAAAGAGWYWGIDESDTRAAEEYIVAEGLVVAAGLRYEFVQRSPTDIAAEEAAGTLDPEALDDLVRRRSVLYTITDKGVEWLGTKNVYARPRRSRTPPVPKWKWFIRPLMSTPRDVFDLSEKPWVCSIPQPDRLVRRRLTKFLARRKAERLSREIKDKPDSIDWVALDWKSPSTAESSRQDEVHTALSTVAEKWTANG